MLCSSCGEKITDGSLFCSSCGARVIIGEVKEAERSGEINQEMPVTAKNKSAVSNKYIWMMLGSYIVSSIMLSLGTYIMVRSGISAGVVVGCVMLACVIINCVLIRKDIRYLNENGYPLDKRLIFLGIVYVPIYIWVRAHKTNKNYVPLAICILVLEISSMVKPGSSSDFTELRAAKNLVKSLEKGWNDKGIHIKNVDYNIDDNVINMNYYVDNSTEQGMAVVKYDESWTADAIRVKVSDIKSMAY